MIFLEGTTFYTRPVLFLFTKYGYHPIGNAVHKVNAWNDQGHEIALCSYVRKTRYAFIRSVVEDAGMRYTQLLCRDKGETYSDLVEQFCPDVLIEDDCKSIGGEKEWCITNVRADLRKNIRSIIVPEFAGIDSVSIT